jgi:hypothetical protein
VPEHVLSADALFFEPFDERASDRLDRLIDDFLAPHNMRLHLTAPRGEVPQDWCAAAPGETGRPMYGVRDAACPISTG